MAEAFLAAQPPLGFLRPTVSGPGFELFQGDAVELLRALPSASVDLVVTDPAYESLEKHRAVGTTTRLAHSKASSNDWFPIFRNARFPELFGELYRVLRKNTHCYVFCDQETAFAIKPMGEAAGFRFWKPLVWDKEAIGMGYHYRARYEFILFFEKGKRKLRNLGISDVLNCKRLHGGYPTEKPVPVYRTLIEQSTEPGALVLDCFCGSGAGGEAALATGRRFVGVDVSPKAIEGSAERLRRSGREARNA